MFLFVLLVGSLKEHFGFLRRSIFLYYAMHTTNKPLRGSSFLFLFDVLGLFFFRAMPHSSSL